VDVAQLVELRLVVPAVAGSIPVVHPSFSLALLTRKKLDLFENGEMMTGRWLSAA
jgi:hypothetical protein